MFRFGTKRVFANRVYQEVIADKGHMHMNSTRWVTLTEFCKHLGRSGIVRVDETEKGWFIAWIDNSPKALAKQEASAAKERLTISDEQRERNLIAEQIEKAKYEKLDKGDGEDEAGPSTAPEVRGLQREEGAEKVVLSFAPKTAPAASAATGEGSSTASGTSFSLKPAASTGLKLNPLKPAANPLKANPLKRPNVFKTAAAASSTSTVSANKNMSAAERLMLDDQERKRRRTEREGTSAS
jgi:DNA/RNA-binding protein KIN17